jgi:exopolyphosphatase/guanosine-5'-triphosphate,3'-diphosphate pyrophosphatase
MPFDSVSRLSSSNIAGATRTVAVVDIGSTSVRMAIAEIGQGSFRILEEVSQMVSLGKDVFSTQNIHRKSIEECVVVLKSCRRLMKEYGITSPQQIRIVGTSAVREANNQVAFLDRVFIATGLEIEALDEAEVIRITYMGVQSILQGTPQLAAAKTLVVEIGSGSTEVMLVRGGNVLFSNTYRLGSLRLLDQVDRLNTSLAKQRVIIESQVHRHVQQIAEHIDIDQTLQMVVLGGDVRLAADNLNCVALGDQLRTMSLSELTDFARAVSNLKEEDLVSRFGISYWDAETLWPALIAYIHLARELQLETLHVAPTNLRDGLLSDIAQQDSWTQEFRNQIVRSAINLGRKMAFDETHARHVANLCRKLFADLQEEHQLDQRMELILYLAALLHEIGLFISPRSHHKHAMYIVRNSELFGLSDRDLLIVSLVVRYHRRSSPRPEHEGYNVLDRKHRVYVSKLAAILRLAIALDESRSQRISNIRCNRDHTRWLITAFGVEDVSLEQLTVRQSSGLFEEVFGMSVFLRSEPG